jgi:hypothetical protein
MSRNVTIVFIVVIAAIICVLAYTMVQEAQTRAALSDLWRLLGEKDDGSFGSARKICDDDLDRALPTLFKAVGDENATRRENAVKMLGAFVADLREKQQKAIEAITGRLDDGEPEVRVEACLVLTAKFRYAGCLDKLEALADADPDFKVRLAALEGIGRVAGEKEVLFLADRIRNGKDDREGKIMKSGASRALGMTGRADALLVLLSQLQGKEGLIVQTEQLLAIAALAGDLRGLKGAGHKEKVINALDEYFARKDLDTLMIQAEEDAAAGLSSSPQGLCGALLNAYHDWGEGKKVEAFLEKMKSAPAEAKKFYEGVIYDYICSLMRTQQIAGGSNIAVVVEVSEEDTALLLDICGKLVDLIGSESGRFALENLRLITGLNIGDDVVKWRGQYEKWTSGKEKFKVEPLSDESEKE